MKNFIFSATAARYEARRADRGEMQTWIWNRQ